MVTKNPHAAPLSPDRRGLPPPLALDLTDGNRRVGWVRGDAIGFRGFASGLEAAHVAWMAYRGLARRLEMGSRRRPIPVDTEPLGLGRRGDAEVVLASGRPIATLLRPGVDDLRDDDSFGFELRVPAPTDAVRMRAMAYAVYRELRTSGVRWGMWARDGRRTARARAARERAARAATTTSTARAAAALAPAPDGLTPGFGWGLAFLVLLPILFLGLVAPREVVVLVAIAALAAIGIAGLLELPRRWWERRTRATAQPAGSGSDGRRRRLRRSIRPRPLSTRGVVHGADAGAHDRTEQPAAGAPRASTSPPEPHTVVA